MSPAIRQRGIAWGRLGLTLAAGGIGGWLFQMAGAPLPFMLGALAITVALALSGVPVDVPHPVRRGWTVVLGVMLGSSFRAETWAHMAHWGSSFAAMIVFLIVSTALVMWFFMRVGGADRVTSFFCALPGGLGEMMMIGPAVGGNERTIVLAHATRVVVVMFVVPPAYRLFAGYAPAAVAAGQTTLAAIPMADLALLTAVGIVGAVVAKAVKLPAWQTIGPMSASAIVHSIGLTDARPPFELLAAAQVVLGCGAGARFAGAKAREMAHTVSVAAAATIMLILLSAAMAWLVSLATGFDFKPLHLAYAPGGFAEMNLIALSLGIEVAFVATHHLGRVFVVVVGGTLVAKYYWAARRPPAHLQGADD